MGSHGKLENGLQFNRQFPAVSVNAHPNMIFLNCKFAPILRPKVVDTLYGEILNQLGGYVHHPNLVAACGKSPRSVRKKHLVEL